MTKHLSTQWSHIQNKLAQLSGHPADSHAAGEWQPNTDVFEGPDDLIVKLEVAGVSKGTIQVQLEEQYLIVAGMRNDPAGSESSAGYRFVQMEVEYGPFRRVISLPYPVDGANAKAQVDNGILKIRLPRARSAGQTRINVIMEI